MCTSLIGLVFCLIPASTPESDQLKGDINAIVAVVKKEEALPVTEFLRNATSGIEGDRVVSAIIAKNALNRIENEDKIRLPLARSMQRIAIRAEFPKDAREYAFSKLRRLAALNEEAKKILSQVAGEITERDKDDLKDAAKKYLQDQRK